jgi:hypothetical protein
VNLDRLRWGEWIAAIAALNLLLVTFRSWYKVTGTDVHVTAWDALETGRYLLIATAIVGIFLWLYQAAEDTGRLSFPMGWVAAAVGLVCTVYIAYRLATPPSDALDPDIGIYLGLVSALGVTIGGLLSAREPETYTSSYATPGDETTAPVGEPEPVGGGADTWSPAAPAAATTGWSPASPGAPVAPATAAGAVGVGDRPVQSGESVVLTAGGARFPAGTVAQVVESFAGGALVEVTAPDGMAERFEVPESAYERAAAGGAAVASAGEGWSPAMPAPATEDWGFDDSSAAAAAGGGAATGVDEAPAETKKTPWWKREIGGGKKKQDDDEGLGAGGALAAGAAGGAAVEAATNGSGEEKPGFFKRLFGGGGSKDEAETDTLETESTPASDMAGIGQAAESDTAVAESAVREEPAVAPPEAFAEPEPTPEPPAVPEPEPLASEPDAGPDLAPAPAVPDPAPAAAAEPEVAQAEPDVAPIASEPEPPATPEPEPVASEPEPPAAPEPEPVASEPEPTPEPPAAPEPEPVASEPEPPAPEAAEPAPEPSGPGISAGEAAAGVGGAGAGAAAAAAAASGDDEEQKPKRKRSSGSRKVPKEAIAASEGGAEEQPRRKRSSGTRKVPKEAVAAAAGGDDQPKVGDAVKLKVGGGRYDAGTRGTVVDVFSAGVIVELSDDEGRTERLDLPFEAIGPADA